MKRWYIVLCSCLWIPTAAHTEILQDDYTNIGTPEQRMQWEAELQPTPEAVEEIAGLSENERLEKSQQIASQINNETFSLHDLNMLLAIAELNNEIPLRPSIYATRNLLKELYETWFSQDKRYHYHYTHLSSLAYKSTIYKNLSISIFLVGNRIEATESLHPSYKSIEKGRSLFNKEIEKESIDTLKKANKSLQELEHNLQNEIEVNCQIIQDIQRDNPVIFTQAMTQLKTKEVQDRFFDIHGTVYNYDLALNTCFNE